jgi:predicted ribosomally synthesized peptide with nif11-like leader
MSRENLERFCQLVRDNQALQDQLQAIPDLQSLIDQSVQLGRDNGYDFTPEEVRQQIETNRRNQEINFPIQDILDTQGVLY